MSDLLKQAKAAAPSMAKAESAEDAAAIGRAALKKQREEATKSLTAVLASEADKGKAVSWERRITTSTMADSESGREIRKVSVVERAGAYGERQFLRMANSAAAAAVIGGWSNAEAVESVGAEIVCRVLAKTKGRMPKRGQLGQTLGDSENPDAAYLTGLARTVIASALRGDRDAAGLAAEAFPVAAAEGAETAALADLAAESLKAAEKGQDAYLSEPLSLRPGIYGPAELPAGDYLTTSTRTAVKRVAVETGSRTAAVTASVVSAIRPDLRAADLAEAGYGASPGSIRKAGTVGRKALEQRLSKVSDGPRYWDAADWRLVESLAKLAAEDASQTVAPHLSETMEIPTYRGASIDWPMRKVEPAAWRNISAESLAAYPSRGC